MTNNGTTEGGNLINQIVHRSKVRGGFLAVVLILVVVNQ